MIYLALEFSTERRSVAVLDSGRPADAVGEAGAPADGALELVERVLARARVEREQVGCLVVGRGPGSYAGIRSAIALAQGWQLATGVPLLGVSSVEGLAAEATAAGLTGRGNVVLDAQRGELYLAGYDLGAGAWREGAPLRLASMAEARARAEAGEPMLGPEVTRWFPTGRTMWPSALTLARLAAGRTDFIPGAALEPIYLRAVEFVKAPPPRVVPA